MLKNQKAFTLVELLVTLSVLAILLSIALPNFQRQIANNRTSVLAEDLIGAINFARIEAIKRGKAITFCPMNDAKTGCGSDWKKGWFVVVDTAATDITKPPVVAVGAILKRWDKLNPDAVITATGGREFIRFTGTGTLARSEGTAVAVITSQVGKCTNNASRKITVALSGMLTTERVTCL